MITLPAIPTIPRRTVVVVAGLVGLAVLVGLYRAFLYPRCLSLSDRGICRLLVKRQKPAAPPTPTPTPTPVPTPTPTPRPIPSGKQTFTVSSGKKTGPQVRSGTIDPYDPGFGSRQVFTARVVSATPATAVTLTVKTDNKSQEIPMELKEGSGSEGTWIGTWVVSDSYLYTYNAVFTATDGTEENTVELTLR